MPEWFGWCRVVMVIAGTSSLWHSDCDVVCFSIAEVTLTTHHRELYWITPSLAPTSESPYIRLCVSNSFLTVTRVDACFPALDCSTNSVSRRLHLPNGHLYEAHSTVTLSHVQRYKTGCLRSLNINGFSFTAMWMCDANVDHNQVLWL